MVHPLPPKARTGSRRRWPACTPAAANKKDVDNVQYLAENMMGRTFCPLGDAAAMPTLAFVKKFRQEFEDYIEGKKAGVPYHDRAGTRARRQNWSEPGIERLVRAVATSAHRCDLVSGRSLCLLIGGWTDSFTLHDHSADQKILIDKSHSH